MRFNASAASSGNYPPASYGDAQYPAVGPNNNGNSYQQYHQPMYPYHQQQYGGYHPHHPSDDSGDRSMGSDSRPTPTNEGDPHESLQPRHSTPRPDSQMQGQYGAYGPPSGGPPSTAPIGAYPSYGGPHHTYPQHSHVHTPHYPTGQGNPVAGNGGNWMNYPVSTPNNPTPPNGSAPSSNPHQLSSTPNMTNANPMQAHHQRYYQGSQQQHYGNVNGGAGFPAPPPFPYQQRRPYSVPPPVGIPSPTFEPPAPGSNQTEGPVAGIKSAGDVPPAFESKEKSLDGTRRKFSFGSQATTRLSNRGGYSPSQHSYHAESPSDSIPAPPTAPPQSAPAKFRATSVEKRVREEEYEKRDKVPAEPLHESRRQNSMLSKFEQVTSSAVKAESGIVSTNPPSTESKTVLRKEPATNSKTPSFDDASLLLGLRTHSNNNSPETVPATVSRDSHDDSDSRQNVVKNNSMSKVESKDESQLHPSNRDTLAAGNKSSNASKTPISDDKTFLSFVAAPETNNLVPIDYPKRLMLPNDAVKLNSLHCFIRAELLEIFVIEPSSLKNAKHLHAPSSSVGRVGLRCVYCAKARRRFQDEFSKGPSMEDNDANVSNKQTESTDRVEVSDGAHIARDDEAPMAVFYPKSISEIYRLVTSWQRCHLRKCRNVPPDVRSNWNERRETDKSRGKTTYWISSAREIGLIDCTSRAGGIRFRIRDSDSVEATVTDKIVSSSKSSVSEARVAFDSVPEIKREDV